MKITTALTIVAHLISSGFALDAIIGVAPKDQGLYKPDSNNKWRCLKNPEIELDFSQVNDDYCDCPDGSDEPGTAACPKGLFYCENKGHFPSYIKSSLVNDGRCDYELCCDGSDEWNTPVECPDRCQEIHANYEKEMALKDKVYKVGSDKASKILRAAKRLRDKLQERLDSEKEILIFLKNELETYKDKVEVLEAKDNKNKQSQDEITNEVGNLEKVVQDSFDEFSSNFNNLRTVKRILDNLVKDYNENLNDNAVKKVVEDFQAHLSKNEEKYNLKNSFKNNARELLKPLQEKNFNSLISNLKELPTQFTPFLETNKDIVGRYSELEKILQYLIDNYNPNFNDANVKAAVQSFRDFISEKSSKSGPSVASTALKSLRSQSAKATSLINSYRESIGADLKLVKNKSSLLDDLRIRFKTLLDDFLGIEPPKPKPSKDDIVNENWGANVPADEVDEFLRDLQANHEKAEQEIASLSHDLSKDFGPDDILRPFEDVSISGQVGEYGYELFIIGDIRQKGKGNENVKVGTYTRYEIVDIDDKTQQFKLFYTNGQRCWNGPLRSAIVTIDCGESNEIVSVSEPEKCEYHFKVKAPIGCKVKKENN